MNQKNWKKDLFTIPNLLSLLRLALIPVYMTIYLRAESVSECRLAGVILALSCVTDLADGYIARRFGMVSNTGKLLDPLADKATQLTLTVSLSIRYPLLRPVLGMLVFKESFQLTAALLCLRRRKVLPGAIPAGKASTALLFTSLTALVVFPTLHPRLVRAMAIANSLTLAAATVSYALAFFGKRNRLQDL